ncbi:condensation domain-containing protein [Dyella silvatica]|uniref:condensation domain-containing protein n=1 Tax=Dyella silvatica TaxID=2992128 RepID=UPI002252AFBD|nr:condensation domain-containing protein [Dyella silvatica]
MIMACIQGHLSEERIRHALARVQAKHPILRSLVVDEDDRPWFALQASPPPIPLRIMDRSDESSWVNISTDELLDRFDGPRQPLARLLWLRGDADSELVLVCHHVICDGRSLVTLLREILLLCDQPDHDIGSYSVLTSLEDVVPAEILTDRRLQRSMRHKVALLKGLLWLARPLLRRPGATPAYGVYGKVYRNFWILDADASRLLLARCKKEGVSAFAAISVAFMLAFRMIRGVKDDKQFVGSVDLRRHLPGLKADSLFATAGTVALSLGKTKLPEDGLAEAGFWTLARALKADMTQKIQRMGPSACTRLLGLEHLHDVYDRIVAYGLSKQAGRLVTLSYLGRMDIAENYRHFHLRAVCGISGMLEPTPANLLVISSFAGRFDFSLASDEQSLPYAQAVQIKEKAMAMLSVYAAATE